MDNLKSVDPDVHCSICKELMRQQQHLELIASENYTSRAVMEAAGSVMTNKYAEGYPHHRYYGGCDYVDEVEETACRRVRELFGADHANVQPHAGSQANMAAYFALLEPRDTILAMDLSHGGHLTHGNPKNFSGKLYKIISYGVDRDREMIDLDEVRSLAREHRPKVIVAGASAYPRMLDFDGFRAIADGVGAVLMVDMAHIAGLVAAGAHPSPVGKAQIVTGTTHKTLRGPRGGFILCDAEYSKRIDSCVFPGMQGGPLMHVIAAKAVCFREASTKAFAEYAVNVVANAKVLASELGGRGYRLVSGGTDNHLILIDVTSLGLTGRQAELALGRAGITVNKNVIPFDTRPPKDPSGVRIGSAASTTRGMGAGEMKLIASWIDEVLRDLTDDALIRAIGGKVRELCAAFPVYPDLVERCSQDAPSSATEA